MSAWRILTVAAAALLIGATPGDRAGDYAVALRIRPAPGGGIQRIDLPAAALIALRNRDATDLRIFDGSGRAVVMARAAPASRMRRDRLRVSPILGPRDRPAGARVSVRLDDSGLARVAEVESAGGGGDAAVVVGALLDARGIAGPAARIDLAVDLPAGQPVALTVEASRDLDQWRPLGRRTGYRDPGAAAGGVSVSLAGAALDHDYLRVTWPAGLIAPVAVRDAVLVREAGAAPVTVAARLPAPVDRHAIEFVMPAAAVTALRIVPAAADGPVPVRLLGRDTPEAPWQPLAAGVADAGRAALVIDGAPRMLRIEADRRGGGFSVPPAVALRLVPQAFVFAAGGPAPFTLAVGRAGAPDALVPAGMLSTASDLPRAVVEPRAAAPLTLLAPDRTAAARRRATLWAVLIAAVAMLGGLVWFLVRRPQPG